MKAAINGAINVSVRDGWWDEGWIGDNGWAIGGQTSNPDEGAQDWSDALDLYRLLEEEIVPRYYDVGRDGRPTAWLDMMKRSTASTVWRFSTTRMLQEYVERLYLPAAVAARKAAGVELAKRKPTRAKAAATTPAKTAAKSAKPAKASPKVTSKAS
jgi:starch phosphorylase